MRISATTLVLAATAILMTTLCPACADSAADQKRIAALEQRVADLEKQVKQLGAIVKPLLLKAQLEQVKAKAMAAAQKRMQQDGKKYTREQRIEIEKLYQVANKNWRKPEAKDALEKLIKEYPDTNRTGCAILYLGQMSQGKTKVDYLTRAITKHGDCYYGNGVQVGAYATFLLAHHEYNLDQKASATKRFAELRKTWPYAFDHKGRLLVQQIPKQ